MAPRRSRKPKATARYYRSHPEAAAKKRRYDTAYHATPARRRYRAELGKARRKAGVMGKGGKDMSHTKSGRIVRESPSKNRARNGSGGRARRK